MAERSTSDVIAPARGQKVATEVDSLTDDPADVEARMQLNLFRSPKIFDAHAHPRLKGLLKIRDTSKS
jgi:hypothetical protein